MYIIPFEKAAPDELIFTLLERDPLFEELVIEWAAKTRRLALDNPDEDKRREKLRQCNEAEAIAWSARERRLGEEEVAELRASYSDEPREIERWRIDISKGTQHLRDAAYGINEATQVFERLELLDADDRAMLASAQQMVNDIASEREPKRASFSERPTLEYLKKGQE
jgi:hypothetical protein